jgi:hypothetical protein
MSRLNQQIALARKLVEEGLYQDNLSKLIRLCAELSQDSAHTLVFFVLKNIFAEIDAKLDTQGNTPEMFQTLTAGIAENSIKILWRLEETGNASNDEIENIVRIHVRNHGVFGAEQ